MTAQNPDPRPVWPASNVHYPLVAEPPTPPSTHPPVPVKSGRSRPLLVLVSILAVALIATTTMWITTASTLSAMQSTEAARQRAAADVPDLRAVADRYFQGVASVSGDANSVEITVREYDVIEAALPLRQLLTELGFSSAVINRMDSTRALDGTLNAEGKIATSRGPTTRMTGFRWSLSPKPRTDGRPRLARLRLSLSMKAGGS